MKSTLIPLLMGAFSILGAAPEPELILDADFAAARENTRGALIVPNGEKVQEQTGEQIDFVVQTDHGSAYTLDDILSEEGAAFLRLQPEKKSYLQANLPDSLALGNDDFSVAFQFRPAATGIVPGNLILSGTAEPSWMVTIQEDGRIQVSFNGHALGSGGQTLVHKSNGLLDPGVWNHVAIVFDRNDSILMYVNGAFDSASSPISSHVEAMPGRVFVGGPHQYPDGDLERLQIFRGKLSEDQVRELAAKRNAAP